MTRNLIFAVIATTLLSSKLRAAPCEDIIVSIGFSANIFAACGLTQEDTGRVLSAVGDSGDLLSEFLHAAQNAGNAAAELGTARQLLISADDANIDSLLADFGGKVAAHQAAVVALEAAKTELRQAVYTELDAATRIRLERSQRSSTSLLPPQYRHLDWPDKNLRELERALLLTSNAAELTSAQRAVIDLARTEHSVHLAEAWLATRLDAITAQFAAHSCD